MEEKKNSQEQKQPEEKRCKYYLEIPTYKPNPKDPSKEIRCRITGEYCVGIHKFLEIRGEKVLFIEDTYVYSDEFADLFCPLYDAPDNLADKVRSFVDSNSDGKTFRGMIRHYFRRSWKEKSHDFLEDKLEKIKKLN